MTRALLALTLAASVASAACSSNYIPQSRGRVSIILDSGSPAYVRDGVTFKHGLLGGGLARAVRGHPQAEAAAREYRSRIGTGLLVSLLGTACVVGSTVSVAVRADDIDDQDEVPIELWTMLGCTVLLFAGVGYAASAEPYRWDAINIFNDAYNPGPMPYPGPYLPGPAPAPGGAPGAGFIPPARQDVTLRMRDE
jgi:hypothetical protein